MSHINEVNGAHATNGINGRSSSAICDNAEEFLSHEYDFVIVGGGTAGLAIAARLTENPDVSVGVLEAGKNRLDDMLVDTPAMFLQMLGNKEYDWMLHTTAQDGNNGKVHHIPRGKLLGGSSGINYMMYVRGSHQDYDDWAALTGDKSWGSKSMAHYMRKHQTLEPFTNDAKQRETMPTVDEFHGTEGPVRTSFNDFRLPIEDDVIKACNDACGMTVPNDPWSGDHIGFFSTLGTVARVGPNKGKRGYAARGYLEPNMGRANLHVLAEAHVSKVELEGDTAKGVSFFYDGSTHTVPCKKEVIVCGGVLLSPQVLELSGIGDPEVLRKAGVECKVENKAVGNNFQDHTVSIAAYQLTPGNMSSDAIYDPEMMAAAQKALMETQGGPLTCVQSVQGFFPYKLFATEQELKDTVQAIRDTPNQTPFYKKQLEQVIAHLESDTSANLQMVLVAATPGIEEGVGDQSKLFPPVDPSRQGQALSLCMCLQYPASRGSIHITSSDPMTPPRIDPGYNSHPADVAVMAIGLKMADKVAKSPYLKDKLSKRLLPKPDLDLENTKQGEEAARDWILGEYHPAGSVAMGDALDSHLRVKGCEGLRVADASAFPNHVSGNIVSSVYATAEHAADIIKADWGFAK